VSYFFQPGSSLLKTSICSPPAGNNDDVKAQVVKALHFSCKSSFIGQADPEELQVAKADGLLQLVLDVAIDDTAFADDDSLS
jgi:hypothetical protein